jgi:branched-chain amino acid transport system permease protein
VYTTVFMYNYFQAPLVVDIICGTAVAGLAGLAVGYLTLRLRGVFFAIATLALAVVLLTFIVNWEYVGGARGAYVITRDPAPLGLASWKHYLYVVIMILTTIALVIARMLEHSKIGRGLAAIRDDELAAECAGVPTLRLKLLSAAASGGLMGMAGTTYPYFYAYAEPTSVFNLSYAVNSIAMPMIGGMTSWLGPLIGALLLGTLQQVVQVTITSNLNLLITGVLLVLFVTLAPNGILGWFDAWKRRRR